jgi:hypothetical protein
MQPVSPSTAPDWPQKRTSRRRCDWCSWRLVLCLVLAVVTVHATAGRVRVIAQESEPTIVVPESECKVKYVYLYSFGLLTTWPESTFIESRGDFVVGVLGEKPFGQILDAIAERKKIGDRRIVVRRFDSMQDYQPSQILYITSEADPVAVREAMRRLKDKPVLVIGETTGFEFTGGVIAFRIEGGNVRFSLNLDEARRRNLVINARLSRLAKTVRDEDGPGRFREVSGK